MSAEAPEGTGIRRAAVFGSPIAHSLSPILHNTAYAVTGLSDWTYGWRVVEASELTEVVAGLDESWRGLSLTMPLKEAAFDVATTVSDVAHRAGAINTLVRRGDLGWDAHNTDVQGMTDALREVDHAGYARILGSGATARSAVLAVSALGVQHVDIAARNLSAAKDLVQLAESLGLVASSRPLALWGDDPVRLVISTLPPSASIEVGGVLTHSGGSFAGMTVLDVVYADWPTPLAHDVTRMGGRAISGLEMLVHQAAAQFELFTGRPAPVEEMLAAGRAALAVPAPSGDAPPPTEHPGS